MTTLGARQLRRPSSSLAQSRISKYYRVSKSVSLPKASSTTSRLSQIISAILQPIEDSLGPGPIDDEFYKLSNIHSIIKEVVRDREGGLSNDIGLGEEEVDNNSAI